MQQCSAFQKKKLHKMKTKISRVKLIFLRALIAVVVVVVVVVVTNLINTLQYAEQEYFF